MKNQFSRLVIACFSIILSVCNVGAESVQTSPELSNPVLPNPVANNAVASVEVNGRTLFYSFNGLGKGKTYKDIVADVYEYDPLTHQSKVVAKVPGEVGRLASVAVTVNNNIYLFGGYTVDADHNEVSTPEVYRFNPKGYSFEVVTHMPVAVDDSVALVYKNRFIYLISGWHNVGNVSVVQVYDTQSKKWFYATPYPGRPVFGHAGGIIDNKMLIVDGVIVTGVKKLKRQFAVNEESFIGVINPSDFTQINWHKIKQHPGNGRYRMAAGKATVAGGLNQQKEVVLFIGGSENAYNYNGIGYNGIPSEPEESIFYYDFQKNDWNTLTNHKSPTMDHRGFLLFSGDLYLLGGMAKGQTVSSQIRKFNLN